MKKLAVLLILIGLIASGRAVAQQYRPVFEMAITLPDGQTKTLSAADSGLTTTTLANGAEYGFRPLALVDRPWARVSVTIFKMGTQSEYTQELGEVELKTTGPAVASKTTPSFKIAVTKVTPPESWRPEGS